MDSTGLWIERFGPPATHCSFGAGGHLLGIFWIFGLYHHPVGAAGVFKEGVYSPPCLIEQLCWVRSTRGYGLGSH